MLVGFAYITPTSLIPKIPIKTTGNTLMNPNVITQEALSELEWALTFTKPRITNRRTT